jgi:hypothetical protein
MVLVQASALTGYWVSVLIGQLPAVATTINLVGLLTGVALPIAVIVLTVRILLGLRTSVVRHGVGPDLTTQPLPR